MRVISLLVLLLLSLLSTDLAALQLRSGHAIVEPGTGLIQFGSNPRWSTARSSYLSVSIDGVVYSNNVISESVAHPLYNGLTSYVQDTLVTFWTTDRGVDIVQRVYEGAESEAVFVVLDVQCVNRSSDQHLCRAQYLLNGRLNETTSLMLVNQRTNTAVSCDERSTDVEGMPDCFLLTLYDMESYPYTPGALSMAVWRRSESTPPTRLVYGAWDGLSNNVWLNDDFYHSSLCDGAVLMQFEAHAIAPGDSSTLIHIAYGVPNYCISSSDDAGALLITDPTVIRHTSTLTADTLTVRAFIWGNAQREIVSPQAVLTVSPELQFFDSLSGVYQSDTLSLGVGLRRREMKVATWRIFASRLAPSNASATTTFSLRSLNRTALLGCTNAASSLTETSPTPDYSSPRIFAMRSQPSKAGCHAHTRDIDLLDSTTGIANVQIDSATNLTMSEFPRIFGSDTSHVRITVLDTSSDAYGVLVSRDRAGNELRLPVSYCALQAEVREKVSGAELSVYPNPTSGALHIETNLEVTSRIEIIDVLGTVRFTSTLASSSTIDTRQLPAGSYTLRVSSASGRTSKRIVVK